MDAIDKAHEYLRHTRIAIWAIVLFLGIVVYLMISISQQLAQENAMDYRSRASENFEIVNNQESNDNIQYDTNSVQSTSCNKACATFTDKKACLQCRCGWYECPNDSGGFTTVGCQNPGDYQRVCGSLRNTPTPIPTSAAPTAVPNVTGATSDNTGCNAILAGTIRNSMVCASGIRVRCVRNNGTPYGQCDLYAAGSRNRYACMRGTQKCELGKYCEGQFIGTDSQGQDRDLMKMASEMCCGGSNGDQPKCSFF